MTLVVPVGGIGDMVLMRVSAVACGVDTELRIFLDRVPDDSIVIRRTLDEDAYFV